MLTEWRSLNQHVSRARLAMQLAPEKRYQIYCISWSALGRTVPSWLRLFCSLRIFQEMAGRLSKKRHERKNEGGQNAWLVDATLKLKRAQPLCGRTKCRGWKCYLLSSMTCSATLVMPSTICSKRSVHFTFGVLPAGELSKGCAFIHPLRRRLKRWSERHQVGRAKYMQELGNLWTTLKGKIIEEK